MCIIIASETNLPKLKYIRNAFYNNDDGAGFGFVNPDTGMVDIHKGFMNVKEFIKVYKHEIVSRWNNGERFPYVLHFRIATHGTVSEMNCHPFRISDTVCVAHNGIIPGFGSTKKNISDTWDFCETILKRGFEDIHRTQSGRTLLSCSIGHSKLVFVDAKENKLFIVNSYLGEWDKKIWYSNKSYKTKFDGWIWQDGPPYTVKRSAKDSATAFECESGNGDLPEDRTCVCQLCLTTLSESELYYVAGVAHCPVCNGDSIL